MKNILFLFLISLLAFNNAQATKQLDYIPVYDFKNHRWLDETDPTEILKGEIHAYKSEADQFHYNFLGFKYAQIYYNRLFISLISFNFILIIAFMYYIVTLKKRIAKLVSASPTPKSLNTAYPKYLSGKYDLFIAIFLVTSVLATVFPPVRDDGASSIDFLFNPDRNSISFFELLTRYCFNALFAFTVQFIYNKKKEAQK